MEASSQNLQRMLLQATGHSGAKRELVCVGTDGGYSGTICSENCK